MCPLADFDIFSLNYQILAFKKPKIYIEFASQTPLAENTK